MPESPKRPPFGFIALCSPIVRPVFQLVAHCRQNITRRRLLRAWSVVFFAAMSVCLMGASSCNGCDAAVYIPGVPQATRDLLVDFLLEVDQLTEEVAGPAARPRITGSDGSQTGLAAFRGNFTAITEPDQGYFVMLRMANCSIAQLTGTSTLNGSIGYSSTTTNYERTLHQLAQLSTTPDAFTKGCKELTRSITSRVGVFAGVTKQGIAVMATAVNYGNSNAVLVLTVNSSISPATVTPITSLSAASALAAGDLNGDGNGDLVAVNDYNAASSYISVVIGNADGTFKAPVNYPIAGGMSTAAVVDDINGDGKEDIVAASDDQHISVLLGNGDGTFQAAQSFSAAVTGNNITSMVTADLRGTGKRDIICSNGVVLLGNGDGTFSSVSAAAFPTTQNLTSETPLGLAAGDLNNDGKVDLVVGTGATISTWIGKGDGTFTQGLSYPSIQNSGYVTVTDLDGDGNLDIYSGLANGGMFSGDDSSYGAAYVLTGNGDGTFQGAGSTLAGYAGNNLGDVNGDGQQDLIGLNPGPQSGYTGTLLVSLGTGKGSFSPASTITAPASFVLGGSTLTGANTAAPSAYAVADINGDKKADLVFQMENLISTAPNTAPTTSPYPVYFTALSNGDGTFGAPVPQLVPQIAPASGFDISLAVSSLAIADFTGSGKKDQVYVYDEVGGGTGVTNAYNRGIAVLPGNGDGTFKPVSILTSIYSSNTTAPTVTLPVIVSASDIDGDGKADLLVTTSTFSPAQGLNNQLQVFLGNGDGTFKTPIALAVPPNIYGTPVLADLNGDGKLDVAALCETSAGQAELAITLGNGDGTFATPTVTNLPGGDSIRSGSLAAADFDADGKVDLALLDYENFSGVFYGKGDGTFTSVPTGNGIVPKDLLNLFLGGIATAVDLNKDGKPDILAGNTILLNLYGNTPAVATQASTTTALSVTPSTSVALGTAVTFTATITQAAGSSGSPTGTVTFLDGTSTLGTAAVAANSAAFSTSALTSGAHTITAEYGGDANFAASTSPASTETVTGTAVMTTTVLSASPTSAVSGAAVTFTAQVSPASGSAVATGGVTFTDGSTTLGTVTLDSTGNAVYTTSALSVGAHSVVAAFAGSAAFAASTSSGVTVTVTVAPAPDFGIALSSATGTVTGGSSVTTTLTITPSSGFNQATTLTCSGAPSGATCGFASNTLTPNGAAAVSTVVTLQTTAQNASVAATQRKVLLVAGLPLGLLGMSTLFAGGFGGRRRRPWLLWVGLVVIVLAGTVGCGGGSSSSTNPSSKSYTLTLTGSSGALAHSTTWTVTVQ